MAKGLVITQTGEITLLKPASMEAFLEKKEKENRENIDFLKTTLADVGKSSLDQGIWNIGGREKIFELIENFISKANQHIYLLGVSEDLVFLSGSWPKPRKERLKFMASLAEENPFH